MSGEVWPAQAREAVSRQAGASAIKPFARAERVGSSPRRALPHQTAMAEKTKKRVKSVRSESADSEADPIAVAAVRMVRMPLDKTAAGEKPSVHLNVVGNAFKFSFGLKNGKARVPVVPPRLPPMPNELAAFRQKAKIRPAS